MCLYLFVYMCSNIDIYVKQLCIHKARRDMLLTYEAKQRALGVPAETRCMKPFDSSLAGRSQDLDLGFAPKWEAMKWKTEPFTANLTFFARDLFRAFRTWRVDVQ